MKKARAILIAGPTASGKSALALELAERLNGVIVNADSMQVYEELSIVTARPDETDMVRVPHRLYGCVPARTAYSTGDWLRAVTREIKTVTGEGRLPILVGGTGLYFKALTEGLAQIPDIDPEVRAACRDFAEKAGVEGVRAALTGVDPEAANGLQDLQRLTRALEVVRGTGRPLVEWQKQAQAEAVLPQADTARLVLAPPRPWLHERIGERAGLILRPGGLAEVEELLKQDLPASLPAMRAIGVKEARDLLTGEASFAEAAERLTVATRQYAKRQETWFRNQMGNWPRIDVAKNSSEALALEFLGDFERRYL
ncbi:tRNA (adenosine(37)-N6)-dimethylallyltransferase MiaA [Roseibium sp. RKSG952]|uniref:tRNA (adenosine(37)-N6)-dimethylallyltransferase MiaA n=1 Tax=Roseibium sp. RKSG952 TaxID=2529384 RepID=UPI001FCCBEC2|nr:tRNA (adenosine(37)-N6)-dimethylallyltransferase MiaA [Roseibium sp. RKSG952]